MTLAREALEAAAQEALDAELRPFLAGLVGTARQQFEQRLTVDAPELGVRLAAAAIERDTALLRGLESTPGLWLEEARLHLDRAHYGAVQAAVRATGRTLLGLVRHLTGA